MTLPYSRNTNYSGGGEPAIEAADLNDAQDGVVNHERELFADDFMLRDEFTGSAVDSGKWITGTTGTGVVEVVSLAGANGCLHINNTGGAGTGSLNTNFLENVLTNDFRLFTKMKVTAIGGGANSVVHFGMNNILFVMDSGGIWKANVTSSHSTGVALDTTAFHTFDIRRTSNVFEFYIDGVLVYSETNSTSLNTATQLILFGQRDASGTTEIYADSIKARIRQ